VPLGELATGRGVPLDTSRSTRSTRGRRSAEHASAAWKRGRTQRRRITVPVLALGGEFGSAPDLYQNMKPLADHVRGGIIAGSGHCIPEEQPEPLARELAAFIDGLRPYAPSWLTASDGRVLYDEPLRSWRASASIHCRDPQRLPVVITVGCSRRM
jgi:hypothetical protein